MTVKQPLNDWIGRTTEIVDIASASPVAMLDALLDHTVRETDFLPPLAHWLHFLPVVRQSDIGADGHPKLGLSLPDLGLPRRMWASSKVLFHQPIAIGSTMTRRTTIRSIEMKHGASGPLGFVMLDHEIFCSGTPCITEEQTLVYREESIARLPAAPVVPATPFIPPPGEPCATRRFGPVELFRFSALTGNTHRIHYDAAYAREIEGYPGLVVHGPLQAMVLMDLFCRMNPHLAVTAFAFRATAPLFAGEQADIYQESGNPAKLHLCPAGRAVSMTASIATA